MKVDWLRLTPWFAVVYFVTFAAAYWLGKR